MKLQSALQTALEWGVYSLYKDCGADPRVFNNAEEYKKFWKWWFLNQ